VVPWSDEIVSDPTLPLNNVYVLTRPSTSEHGVSVADARAKLGEKADNPQLK
jgi:hypothetical protein